jgi:hypothetical protein
VGQDHAPLELPQESRLAHAGLADQRDHVRPALTDDALEQRLQRADLVVASDERRLARRRGAARGVLRDRPKCLPGRHRLGLALELERLELLVADGVRRGARGGLADRDASGPRGALEAGGDVHGVANDRVGVADRAGQDLAGVDADAKVEVDAVGESLVDLLHRVLHAEGGPDRTFGIVLMGHGRAEQGHDVVADVLVDGAAEARHLLAQAPQRALHERLDRLGIHPLGHRRVAGQVGEQHGDAAALLGRRLGSGLRGRGRRVEGRAAVRAEARLRRRLLSAVRAATLELLPAAHAEARPGGILSTAGPADRPGHVSQVTTGLSPR